MTASTQLFDQAATYRALTAGYQDPLRVNHRVLSHSVRGRRGMLPEGRDLLGDAFAGGTVPEFDDRGSGPRLLRGSDKLLGERTRCNEPVGSFGDRDGSFSVRSHREARNT